MKTLYALFAAINNYPDPRLRLDGCLNDLDAFKSFLEGHCTKLGYQFKPLVLKDGQASRKGIVAGFDHFNAAGPDDSCLFFYAGHGSQAKAPQEFAHRKANGMSESIVCHDSRSPGGKDLLDVELSWLVWKASKGKNLPFVTVLDCCHSGRMRKVQKGKDRQVFEPGAEMQLKEYLGVQDYKKSKDGKLSPPQGRRINLGAALSTETAKEVTVGLESKGVFSYCLLEALTNSSPFISYSTLVSKINVRVRSLFLDQSPQLESTEAQDKNLVFLTGEKAQDQPVLAAFEPRMGWSVNAGAVHGIRLGDENSRTVFELAHDKRRVEVTEVLPSRSKVSGMDDLDRNRSYPARPVRMAVNKLGVAFAGGNDPGAEKLLRDFIEKDKSDLFRISGEPEKADYRIHAKDGAFFLTSRFNDIPLFRQSPGFDRPGINQFVSDLEKVAAWRRLLELSNPGSAIREDDLKIELFRGTEPGNTGDDMPVALQDWRNPEPFEYLSSGAEWHQPTFQLKITNTKDRPVWISVLYLNYGFGVTNQLIPKELLEKDQEAWAKEILESGEEFKTNLLQLEDYLYQKGIAEIQEYLIVLASTEELNTDTLNQEPLPHEPERTPMRSLARRGRPVVRDWATWLVPVRVVRGTVDG